MKLSISVIVPVYNVEQYIYKCAESLFNNTIAKDCEFIFINDCSTDKSIDLLQSIISQYNHLSIRIINHEKNNGISITRNTGFANANGEYIVCVDSDDWVEKDYLELLYSEAKAKNYDIVGCDYFLENNNVTIIYKSPLYPDSQKVIEGFFTAEIGSYFWLKLFKREFINKNGILCANDIFIWEDMLFFVQFFSNNPSIGYINKPLYHYVKRNGSCLSGLYTEKKADNIFKAIEYINNYMVQNNMNYAFESFNSRSYRIKLDIISKGNKFVQKKYLSLYKNLNIYKTKNNTKLIYSIIISLSNKSPSLAFFILHIFSLIKCLFHRINYKEYISI